MSDFRVVTTKIAAADADAMWDTVHVKVVGAARDADVPLNATPAEVKSVLGKKTVSEYQEVWSFLRRRGVKSKIRDEAACPGCGAPLELGASMRCKFCNAVSNSGEHDWVLAEITQPEEWSPADSSGDAAGLADIRARDPAISRQELEDRASVLFWKWIEASATRKNEVLNRFGLTPGALHADPRPLFTIAVGSSDVRYVNAGAALPNAMDQATLDIRWSAAASPDGEPQPHTAMVIMARLATAVSKRGLSSLDCPNCGGPLAESDAPTCTYCGEALTGGKNDWVLLSVMDQESPPSSDDSDDGDDGDGGLVGDIVNTIVNNDD
jgi:hypothetical protein